MNTLKALIPSNQLETIPSLNEEFSKESLVYAHLFSGGYDYWVMGFDPVERIMFGYAKFAHMPDCAEFGYQSLLEIEETNQSLMEQGKYLMIIENEANWEPVPFSSLSIN